MYQFMILIWISSYSIPMRWTSSYRGSQILMWTPSYRRYPWGVPPLIEVDFFHVGTLMLCHVFLTISPRPASLFYSLFLSSIVIFELIFTYLGSLVLDYFFISNCIAFQVFILVLPWLLLFYNIFFIHLCFKHLHRLKISPRNELKILEKTFHALAHFCSVRHHISSHACCQNT